MRGPLAVMRDRLAVDLASLAVMREPLAVWPGWRAVMRGQGPRAIGSKTAENGQKIAKIAPRPRALAAQARAMFLSNNYVKNDMNVSRETLPNN